MEFLSLFIMFGTAMRCNAMRRDAMRCDTKQCMQSSLGIWCGWVDYCGHILKHTTENVEARGVGDSDQLNTAKILVEPAINTYGTKV